ncbi:probable LRR receptor-like serine/threonine-protein kinase At5g48740 [Euphorbia lathyris]|uniref:probable LRR receptor-like serine/threonine-protein kinase At5g48740 n=1 Tax=Euphorbia lathyris TaxID=212925 RepID=UPI0033134626
MALKCLCFAYFIFSTLWIQGFCNNQNGFLSLSCGGASDYTDSSTISWVSDNEYIKTGNTSTISAIPIRFFPDKQSRNCYKLPLSNSSSLTLLRAQFVYKNYDNLRKPPVFSVSIGTAIVATVNLSSNDPWIEEFVWPVNKDTLSLCLHAIPDGGYPVISSLEVRPIPRGAYQDEIGDFPVKSLRKAYRINSGYTNGSLRYPSDPFDRIWDADQNYTPFHVSTGFSMLHNNFNLSTLIENPPLDVLQTARVLARKDVLTYNLALPTQSDYFILLYFAGILPVSPSFDVLINGNLVQSNYTVTMSQASVLHLIRNDIKTLNITLKTQSFYPQINAIEVYQIVEIPLEASSTTVSALEVIQHSTGLDLEWEDDPCSPFPWDHIGCEGNLVTSLELSDVNLRSISPTFGDLLDLKMLDLHNTSLAGEIQNLGSLQHLEKLNLSFNRLTSFGVELDNLVSLQSLDLQNNSLEGTVPDGIGELEELHLLNLENNKLEGTLPGSLNRESLEVRTSGNPCLSFSTLSCNDDSSNPSIETPQVTMFTRQKPKQSNHIAIILGAAAGTILALLIISLSVFFYLKKQTAEILLSEKTVSEMRNWNAARIFTYKEIKAATNNFKEVIGRGSFGSVHLGKLSDGKQVAVKVRFDKTQLGAESFVNEVYLLSRIRHQNLVGLEGFCSESKKQILVYEYLPGGSLADHLYGSKRQKVSLSWIRRLKIAVDAAKGLDYLHNGSEPRIIHRDVKCSNIMLDKDMNAKVCDFGLSKQVMQADASHVTTVVKGTAGYLDPEYYSTQQLTEKSDVYSFGVVVLELICGREPLRHLGTPDSFNLVLWAKPYLQAGAYEIVDDSIKGTFDAESMRKTATVAVRSVDRDAALRPNIAEVLAELKEAYDIQLAYLAARDV